MVWTSSPAIEKRRGARSPSSQASHDEIEES
jgi:hypothetical protein